MRVLDNEKLSLLAAFLLLVIALLVTFRRRKTESSITFLSLYFWCFFYMMFTTYLVSFRYVIELPHLYRTGLGASLLMMPAVYLYIRQSLLPKKFSLMDLLHLLPFLLYQVDYMPFFLKSAEYKIGLIQSYDQQELTVGFNEGWFMPRYGFSILRYMQVFLYIILQWRMIVRVQRSKEHPVSFANPETLSWMKMLVFSEVVLLVPPILGVIFMGVPAYGTFSILGGIVMALMQCYFLLSHPEVLYGISTVLQREVVMEEEPEPDDAPENQASDEMVDEVGAILDSYMTKERPYLKGKFKLQDLSDATGLPIHRISAFVNRRKNMNFFAYLNQYRLEEFLSKLSSGEHESKTLEAMAEECGFQNRTTFIRVFKLHTGKTPSAYIAGLQMT
jgi:AraC-like DNA-binding protein